MRFLSALLVVLLGSPGAGDHETGETAEFVDAMRRGRQWLAAQKADDGSFAPRTSSNTPRIALTALALWALSVSADPEQSRNDLDTVEYLIGGQGADGGIYPEGRGLSSPVSAVVRRSFTCWQSASGTTTTSLDHSLERLEGFLEHRRKTPNNRTKTRPSLEETLREIGQAERHHGRSPLPGEKRALAFLRRVEGSEVISPSLRASKPFYHLGETLDPKGPVFLRTLARLREDFTLTRNPGLLHVYSPEVFAPGDSGLYYYYLTVARVLEATAEPFLITTDGTRHEWSAELGKRLVDLQRTDGSWSNSNGRWWESEPVLVTSYALITLDICRRIESRE